MKLKHNAFQHLFYVGYWRYVNNFKPTRVLCYSGSDHQCNIAHQQCYWTDFLVAKEECYKWDACKLLWETKEFGNLGTPVYWARGARGSAYEGVGYREGSVLWEFMPGKSTCCMSD